MIFAGGEAWGPREGDQLKKAKRREHSTYIMVPGTCIIPGTTAVCSKNVQRRTTQDRKTKGKARHRTMQRCAAELFIAGLT